MSVVVGPVRLAEAARAIGWSRGTRALRKLIRRREQELGVRILINVGTPGRPFFDVQMGNLRQHMPELFSDDESLRRFILVAEERMLERVFDAIDDRFARLERRR